MTVPDPTDEVLATALRSLGAELAWPSATARTPDLATRVRAAIVEQGQTAPVARPTFAERPRRPAWPSVRRLSLVLALIALLALAAVAGAAVLGLPGLRLTLGDAGTPPPSRSADGALPTDAAPGEDLGLGTRVSLEEARRRTGRAFPLPIDPALEEPDAVYLDPTRANQVAVVWASDADLPPTLDPGIGLILMSFDGTVHEGFFEKAISSGSTIEPVGVGGRPGFWISGDPHVFFYRDPAGGFVDDERRWVGDALLWSDGTTTWRIESALGRARTIELAERLID